MRNKTLHSTWLVTLAGALLSNGIANAQVVIDHCGQSVRGKAVLAADLDCSADATDSPTLVLKNGSSFDLRGFTLTSRPGTNATVLCRHSCRILGPGTIVGSDGDAVRVDENHFPGSRIQVDGATVTGGRIGVYAMRVDLHSATVTACGEVGLWTFRATVDDSTITNNGLNPSIGVQVGVFGQVTSLIRNSTITGNGRAGVDGWGMNIQDSTVTGNTASPVCGPSPGLPCADLISTVRKPVLVNTVCDSSLGPQTSSWGVCSSD